MGNMVFQSKDSMQRLVKLVNEAAEAVGKVFGGGKGTGALREEIQKFLKTTPGVVSAKDESIQLGGSGVTVVTFDK